MEPETVKLLNVLRLIARAAGYAAWTKARTGRDTVLRCSIQPRARSTFPNSSRPVRPLFTPLGENASPASHAHRRSRVARLLRSG